MRIFIILITIIQLTISIMNSKTTIQKVLNLKPNWAIVGLSNNKDRPAYHVSKFLVDNGYKIYPIHPKAEEVHGFKGYSSLEEVVKSGITIDVVDIFVNSNLAGEVVDEAIRIQAKAVWLQEGVIDDDACKRLV